MTATEEKKKKVRDKAIQAYKNELFTPEKFDLGIIIIIRTTTTTFAIATATTITTITIATTTTNTNTTTTNNNNNTTFHNRITWCNTSIITCTMPRISIRSISINKT